jgi:hypothetical protein
MPHRDPNWTQDDEAPPRGQRLAAVCAVALIVLSCGLLQSLTNGARPIQSMGLLFGPAAAAERY